MGEDINPPNSRILMNEYSDKHSPKANSLIPPRQPISPNNTPTNPYTTRGIEKPQNPSLQYNPLTANIPTNTNPISHYNLQINHTIAKHLAEPDSHVSMNIGEPILNDPHLQGTENTMKA